ncbi:MAG TPA: aldehyde dehydrogenase family protein, partial [Streptosporangiaceae bacterium]|nr:aldehyde dehydrogenase family protein [Streptosporangiaceae bacterium]
MTVKRAERGQSPPAGEVTSSQSTDVAATSAGPAWDYAPAPESREIVTIAGEYGLFVDGEFGPAADRRQFPTINPATEETLAHVALASPADVDRAVAAARHAYSRVWGPMPGAERAKYLYRIA